MNKLKIILQSNYLYYLVLLIALFLVFVSSKEEHNCIYDDINNKSFIITKIIDKEYGLRLTLKGDENIIGSYYLEKSEINKFLKIYTLGDLIRVRVSDQTLKNNTIENTFNYKEYLYNQHIFHNVVIEEIELLQKNNSIFYKLKNYFINKQQKLEKSYKYINSLLLGNNSDIDEDVMESYRANGISHLFAISGLHISLFILIISKILKKFGITNLFKSIVLVLFLLFYMFLTNFSMSVVRASIFTILLIINKLFHIDIKPINLLLLAFSIILFINPLFIYSIGLQYSFLITFFLIKFGNVFGKKVSFFKKLFLTSMIAFLTSYPITINNFYEINFLSIFYNIFFVPYVSYLLLPFSLITYFLPFFDGVLYILISIIEFISQFIEHITIFKIIMCKLSMPMVILYYVLLCLVLSKVKQGNYRYLLLLVIFCIANFSLPFHNESYVEFLDVAQGDSAIINVNHEITLIDTGGFTMYNDNQYTYQLTKHKLLPYLKSRGIRKIDNLILTHGDADHMRESLYLVDKFKVDNIYINDNELNNLEKSLYKLAIKKKIKFNKLKEGIGIKMKNYSLLSLNKKRNNENDSSIVLLVVVNNDKILFTGDISKEIELDLMNVYNFSNVHILKLAHHGSKTSSDYNFLKSISPKYSIISVGEDNKFSHPSVETINNLKKLNLKYYETSRFGSIRYNFDTGTFKYFLP